MPFGHEAGLKGDSQAVRIDPYTSGRSIPNYAGGACRWSRARTHPGRCPHYLAGRGRERALIRDKVSRLSMLGLSGGPLLAFHAARGLQKTSLLRIAQPDALAEGSMTVWVAGRDD